MRVLRALQNVLFLTTTARVRRAVLTLYPLHLLATVVLDAHRAGVVHFVLPLLFAEIAVAVGIPGQRGRRAFNFMAQQSHPNPKPLSTLQMQPRRPPRTPPLHTPLLEIEPCAGLANRLRAIASAITGAQDLGRSTLIHWVQSRGTFSGSFHNLFEVAALPEDVYVNDADYSFSTHRQQDCLSPEDWERISTNPHTLQKMAIPLKLKSYGHFHQKDPERWIQNLRALKPRRELELHVEAEMAASAGSIWCQQPTRFIGVHIRRTDHKKAIEESPTAAFIVAMDALDGPGVIFVVASDDRAEREFIAQRYPGRVLTFAEHLNRNTTMGGVDAMLDFLALSKCKEILGSAHSSFSELAAMYGGCPLKIVRLAPNA